MKRDKHHRIHQVWPRTGPLFVFNRASKFHSPTCLSHASDLTAIFKEVKLAQKPVVSLIVDGGPDQSPSHTTNFLLYGRLWRDQQLDCLIVATHAPGQSAYNCIEHAWSLLSQSLTGVTLPNHLPGECPPIEQKLGAVELHAKEAEVFDNAIGILNGYWNGKSFDGHPIKSVAVKCIDSSQHVH